MGHISMVFNDKVTVENEYLYPLLKSSDLANNRLDITKIYNCNSEKDR